MNTSKRRGMRDVASAFSETLSGPFTIQLPLEVEADHRIIIFSDQHKGGGRGGDDFEPCKPAYLSALAHYRELGFTLMLLGDAEELWEEDFKRVRAAHEDALRKDRIWGASSSCTDTRVRGIRQFKGLTRS